MNSGNNSCAPKKLRQLSITDLFGPCQKKRKVESAGLFNRDDSRGGGSLEFDAVAKNSTERKMEKQCLSEKRNDAITAQINSSKFEQQTDQCQSNRGGESSTEHSSSSQQLINDIIAERSEQCSQFLHRDIPDDDDISQLTPDHKKKDSIGQKQISAKENKEDKLLIYDSPDMFADTFPTQDFDINQQFGDDETSECKWKGKPKSLLKVAPECLPILPKLKPLTTHTILFDTTFFDFGPPPPSWSTYVDAWDSIHVKLPCSPKSLFPVVINKNTTLKQRWELIENALLNDMKSANDLEKAIKSYNVKMNQPFYILRALLNDCFNDEERTEFFAKTLPEMVKLALSLPALITQPIPLLTRQRAHCITISQQQCACLLANAFFCTFPRRNSTNPDAEYSNYPTINFNRLHIGKATRDKKGVHIEKLKTLLHYFKRVTTDMPSGVVTFERKVCQEFPVWSKSPSKLCGLHVRSKGLIEDEGKGMLQIDFANKFIGGGVLSSGMVQEEILFCIFPELLISRLFTEVMDDNECVCVTGAERFSSYSGYGSEYIFEGNCDDVNTRDVWRRKISHFVALDATYFSNQMDQYKVGNVRRELNKLYCGFQDSYDPDFSSAIATGNWGCGAFRGDPIFKALLQMMASAVVCRDLCYITFGDEKLMETIYEMHTFITSQELGVDDLWKLICQYNEQRVMPSIEGNQRLTENIFDFVQETISFYDASTDEDN